MKSLSASECDPYYTTYTSLVPEGALNEVLSAAPQHLAALLASVPAERESYIYAPGKWSIREVVGHVIDTERIFAYRALHIARGDAAALPGMDQDVWAEASNAGARSLARLLEEFRDLRAANTNLFASFDDATLTRRGTASGVGFSVRALMFIVAGHEMHHRKVLEERYLPGLQV